MTSLLRTVIAHQAKGNNSGVATNDPIIVGALKDIAIDVTPRTYKAMEDAVSLFMQQQYKASALALKGVGITITGNVHHTVSTAAMKIHTRNNNY